MKRNTDLLEQVMTHILDHPELHNQEVWFCGTAACFAGWACLMSGWERAGAWDWRPSDVVRDGVHDFASEAASVELGLTEDEADTLFAGSNTREMLALMVKDLVNGEELRPQREYAEMAA